jgi:hypothetical protein
MNEMYAVLAIGLSIFSVLAVLVGLGQAYGGSWAVVAQGVTTFILIIVGFVTGCFVLVQLIKRH